MKMKLKIGLTFVLLVTLLTGCAKEEATDYQNNCWDNIESGTDYQRWVGTYFDTTILVQICTDNKDNSAIYDEIETIIKTYHQLSDKRNAYSGIVNIYTINNNPTKKHTISSELKDMIELSMSVKTDQNLFNIALDPVITLWETSREDVLDFGKNVRPSVEDLEVAALLTSLDDITLEGDTIQLKEGMSLNLGAMAKGYMVNILTEYLEGNEEVSSFIIDAGGNISVGGAHPKAERDYYVIGVEDPIKNDFAKICFENCIYEQLRLNGGQTIVTSGDYQRYYVYNDNGTEIKYHHIIDPVTMYPKITNVKAVSVVTDNSALADIYSTTVFLLDLEEAKQFVNTTDNLEAVWFLEDGTIIYSDNFEALIHN
jgi:thiamine biosynthesis lipoprotein